MPNNAPPFPRRLPEPLEIRSAPVEQGAARGRELGYPTINVALRSAPPSLTHGIYACWVTANSQTFKGAMHYGPRPVFNDTETLEIHLIDAVIDVSPRTIDIAVIAKIREVEDFPSTEALLRKIAEDIQTVRAILEP